MTKLRIGPIALVALAASAFAQAPRSPLAPARWFAEAKRNVERAEYGFEALDDGAFTAPNRAQGLRARIDERGARVEPRDGSGDFALALRTRAFGFDGALRELGTAPPVRAGQRVELRRQGFVEWFANDARGLEQGWTVAAAPDGAATLAIELELVGFHAALGDDPRAARFVSEAGIELEYAELAARDAEGRALDARFEAGAHGLALRVDVAQARFPVLVDPILRGLAWSARGGQTNADFGNSLAGAGDVNGDGYGDLIVGASLYDAGQSDEGRAFLFLGSPSGPSTTPSWTAESNQSGAQFGQSVASAGDVNGDGYDDVIVGSHEYDHGEAGEGRAYCFLGSASGLSPTASWIVEGDSTIVALGYAVAGAGDVNGDGYDDVIVSAPFWHNPIGDEGAAFVYHGSASGLSPTWDWMVEGNQTTAQLGRSVAGAGDVNGDGYDDVIVGAHYYDSGQTDEGRAFCYLGSASGLSTTPAWFVDGDQVNAHCGQAVAGAGDVNGDGYDDVLVGTPFFGPPPTGVGRVQLFYGSANGLSTSAAWTALGPQANCSFGFALAGLGDVNGDGFDDVCAGAYGFGGAFPNEGLVELFLGSPSGPPAQPDWSAAGGQATAFFGYALGRIGDLDGDGFAELAAGAALYDGSFTNEGAVFLWRGQAFCDCNANGVDDDEDVAMGTSPDCNGNGIPDECDVSAGTSEDADQNGVPDECECAFQSHCATAPNSVDATGARIGWSGSGSIPANDLVLTAGPCPTNEPALFYFGPNAIQVPFGNGWRCVGGAPIKRLPVITTGAGTATYALDYSTRPGSLILPGSHWSFQCWYRDPAAGGANFNLSDALAIDFCY